MGTHSFFLSLELMIRSLLQLAAVLSGLLFPYANRQNTSYPLFCQLLLHVGVSKELRQIESDPSAFSEKCSLSASTQRKTVRKLTWAMAAASSGLIIFAGPAHCAHQTSTEPRRFLITRIRSVSMVISVFLFFFNSPLLYDCIRPIADLAGGLLPFHSRSRISKTPLC